MSETYHIHKDVIHTIFNKVIDPNALNCDSNAKHILQILTNDLSDSSIEAIIHLMLLKKEYKALKIDDYIILKAPSYLKGKEYETDILNDMGLLPKEDDHVYGIVTGDTSWSVDKPFNPFYSRIKVDLLLHDRDKKLNNYQHEVNPLQCKRVSKKSIPRFKNGFQTELNLTETVTIDNLDNF